MIGAGARLSLRAHRYAREERAMHIYYAVMIAAVVGAAVGAGAITALNAQTTAKAYIVTEVDVTGNMDLFLKDYAAHVQATVDPFGGRYLVRGGRNVGVEGDPPKGRIVISVFDSFEKAQAWRDSPEYKKILTVREREAKSRMYIVEGLPGVQ
jgi:uncharacterized protein (DUF1330 family)